MTAVRRTEIAGLPEVSRTWLRNLARESFQYFGKLRWLSRRPDRLAFAVRADSSDLNSGYMSRLNKAAPVPPIGGPLSGATHDRMRAT